MNESQTLKAIIEQRKSIYPKDYTGVNITKDILNEILKVGCLTPNHKKTAPWRYQLFLGEQKDALAEEMAKLYKTHTPEDKFLEKKYLSIIDKIKSASAIISTSVAISDTVPEWEEIAAVSMGVQNMYLLCSTYQLGCYWSTPKFATYLSEFLNLNDNEKCLGLFYIGTLEHK